MLRETETRWRRLVVVVVFGCGAKQTVEANATEDACATVDACVSACERQPPDPRACTEAARRYEHGIGVPADAARALVLHRRAWGLVEPRPEETRDAGSAALPTCADMQIAKARPRFRSCYADAGVSVGQKPSPAVEACVKSVIASIDLDAGSQPCTMRIPMFVGCPKDANCL